MAFDRYCTVVPNIMTKTVNKHRNKRWFIFSVSYFILKNSLSRESLIRCSAECSSVIHGLIFGCRFLLYFQAVTLLQPNQNFQMIGLTWILALVAAFPVFIRAESGSITDGMSHLNDNCGVNWAQGIAIRYQFKYTILTIFIFFISGIQN